MRMTTTILLSMKIGTDTKQNYKKTIHLNTPLLHEIYIDFFITILSIQINELNRLFSCEVFIKISFSKDTIV